MKKASKVILIMLVLGVFGACASQKKSKHKCDDCPKWNKIENTQSEVQRV